MPHLFKQQYRLHDVCVKVLCANQRLSQAIEKSVLDKGMIPDAEARTYPKNICGSESERKRSSQGGRSSRSRTTAMQPNAATGACSRSQPTEVFWIGSNECQPLQIAAQCSPRLHPLQDHYKYVGEPITGIKIWMHGRRYLVCGETVSAKIQPTVSRASLRAIAGCPDSELFLATSIALLILLSYQQRYSIHAGAACQGEYGCLLIGPSGCGKSTFTMGLIAAGWNYLSDDTLLLRAEEPHVRALAYRHDFCLDPRLREHFPVLATQNWSHFAGDRHKWWVNIRSLYPDQFTPSCVPRVLLFPQIVDAAESRLVPMDKSTALLNAIPQTGMLIMPDKNVAQPRLHTLKRLINQSQAYRLLAGQDLRNNPLRASYLLESVCEDVFASTQPTRSHVTI